MIAQVTVKSISKKDATVTGEIKTGRQLHQFERTQDEDGRHCYTWPQSLMTRLSKSYQGDTDAIATAETALECIVTHLVDEVLLSKQDLPITSEGDV